MVRMMKPSDASRIQSAEARQSGTGGVSKKSFSARAQSAAARNFRSSHIPVAPRFKVPIRLLAGALVLCVAWVYRAPIADNATVAFQKLRESEVVSKAREYVEHSEALRAVVSKAREYLEHSQVVSTVMSIVSECGRSLSSFWSSSKELLTAWLAKY